MEECYICFSNLELSDFKSLPCFHKICFSCYLRLEKSKCPLCRKDFKYNKEDIIKIAENNFINNVSKEGTLTNKSYPSDTLSNQDHTSSLNIDNEEKSKTNNEDDVTRF